MVKVWATRMKHLHSSRTRAARVAGILPEKIERSAPYTCSLVRRACDILSQKLTVMRLHDGLHRRMLPRLWLATSCRSPCLQEKKMRMKLMFSAGMLMSARRNFLRRAALMLAQRIADHRLWDIAFQKLLHLLQRGIERQRTSGIHAQALQVPHLSEGATG